MLRPKRLFFYGLISKVLPETSCFKLKAGLLRWCGASVGKEVHICSSAVFLGTGELILDDNVFIGQQTFITSSSRVHVGKQVGIGPQVYIGTGSHEIDGVGLRSCGRGYNKDIVIRDGAWIALRSVLLPGITIGHKAVVCAGAVVTKDVMDRTVVAGIPATMRKRI